MKAEQKVGAEGSDGLWYFLHDEHILKSFFFLMSTNLDMMWKVEKRGRVLGELEVE